jgi:SAM-dependent methyltransferase
MKKHYKEDLAFIHDVGFGGFAINSAPGILDIFDQSKIRKGLVVDLGCGSGLWAEILTKAQYDVLGIDISEAMIRVARSRAPKAEFRVQSLFDAEIPRCEAVTSLGECVNYLFDRKSDRKGLARFFHRIYNALAPGGVFVFDIAEPGQVKPYAIAKSFTEGDGWAVLVEKQEDPKQGLLTRRIITFRRVGKFYRRDEELHRQRLYTAADIAMTLRKTGFRVRVTRSYGDYRLPEARAALIARKPA